MDGAKVLEKRYGLLLWRRSSTIFSACGRITAGGAAQGFAQRTCQNIDAPLDAAVFGCPPAGFADKASGVAVIPP